MVAKSFVTCAALLSVLIVAGCGSGSSTPPPTTPPNPSPTITSLTPAAVSVGAAGTTIAVAGSGFVSASVVQWNGTSLTTTYTSATAISADLPAGDLSSGAIAKVTVVNPAPGGGTSAAATFTVNNPLPVITTASPTSVTAGAGATTISLTGTGFVSASVINWNGTALATTVVSPTSVTASLPASDLANATTAMVTVVNPAPGGGTSAAATFTVNNPLPVLTSASPAGTTAGAGATTIALTGTGFISTSVVNWNGTALTTTVVSPTALTVALPASDLSGSSASALTASNPAPGGGTSAPLAFNVNSPVAVITALSPSSVEEGMTGTITVAGSGFETNSMVLWNGSSRPTTFVSATNLQVALTAADLQTAGQGSVTVSNPAPNANASMAAILTVTSPAPVITSLTPASLPANPNATGSTDVVIAGSNFSPSATVVVNSQQIMTSAISATSITAQLPAAFIMAPGVLSFQVYNPSPDMSYSYISSNVATLNVVGAPTITSITPSAAPVGSADLQITVTANSIFADSTVLWNGTALATTYAASGEMSYGPTLTATIPAADLATLQGGTITVSSPEEAPTATSPGQAFSVYVPLQVNNLAINPVSGLLYASTPGAAGAMGNSVVGIDPLTGAIVSQVFVGSEPTVMAISDDGTQLYVGLSGAGAVRQVDLTTGVAGLQFSLGGGPGVYNPPFTAQGMAAVPGEPNSLAVYASSGVLTVYDSGVARPNDSSSQGLNIYFDQNSGSIAFGNSAATLYALTSSYNEVLYQLTINSTGVTAAETLSTLNSAASNLQYDNGRLYLSNGTVLDASSGSLLGQFSLAAATPAAGPIVSDSSLGRAWIIPGQEYAGTPNQVLAFNEATFTAVGSFSFSGYGVNFLSSEGYSNGPTNLLRWGPNGLAFASPTQVYALQSPVVQDLSASPADVSVALNVPAMATAGTALTYTITVSNAGPNSAQNIVVTSPSANGSQNLSVTGSSASASTTVNCLSGSQVLCTIPALASGSTATVTVVFTPTTPGNFITTAGVYPVSYDPSTANNQATATTVVSGVQYSAVPSVSSLAPALAASGSPTFTLTVNGQGFDSGSVVEWNGAALPTTLDSSIQLTATVDQSLVTALGWAQVSVTNAAPGGGASAALTFSIYQVVSIQANSIAFDPFTRELYASIPSTAAGITGNSVTPIDPFSGTIGTPIFVGSEPNMLAETDDGKYLWIGLDGANSLTQFNLLTQTPGAAIPISITQYGSTTSTKAQSLKAQPGSDTTLAIDTGEGAGIGIFDVNGNTGAFRANFTGIYDGNNPVFGDANHLYAHDDETTGDEFYAYTVDANGLTNLYGYTFNGFGEFSGSGFAIGADGFAYGPSGGIVNPANPPSQIALLPFSSSSTAFFEGDAVIPDTSQGYVFAVGSSNPGAPVLQRYSLATYTLDTSLALPPTVDGQSAVYQAVHFGQDGLALNVSPGFGGTSTADYQILLFRGPFMLAAEAAANPAPALTGTTLSIIAVNSGNQYLTVTGTGFMPGAVVLWNGSPRTTTFVDAGHLQAAIPASDLTAAATVALKADNPGSGDSNSISITVQ